MTKRSGERKTQAERRAASQQAVLDSACRLFGEHGYAGTSLEQIAADCGLTIRPIYHYFANKKGLFAAVNDVMEQRILASMQVKSEEDGGGVSPVVANWRSYLDLCEDPGFRQIVLVDSPNILGRDRWRDSVVTRQAQAMFLQGQGGGRASKRQILYSRVFMAAFAEAALVIAESDDFKRARKDAEQLIESLFASLPGA